MAQTIAVILIVVIAVSVAAVWAYRSLTGSGTSGCDPSRCANCPYAARPGECRPGPEKNSKKR